MREMGKMLIATISGRGVFDVVKEFKDQLRAKRKTSLRNVYRVNSRKVEVCRGCWRVERDKETRSILTGIYIFWAI